MCHRTITVYCYRVELNGPIYPGTRSVDAKLIPPSGEVVTAALRTCMWRVESTPGMTFGWRDQAAAYRCCVLQELLLTHESLHLEPKASSITATTQFDYSSRGGHGHRRSDLPIAHGFMGVMRPPSCPLSCPRSSSSVDGLDPLY